MQRACGECYACCTAAVVRFENYTKPARKTCLHVLPPEPRQVGRCGLFGQSCRPSECSGFECAWKRAVVSERHRPDVVGVMFSVNTMNGGTWGFAVELEQGALLGRAVDAAVEFARAIPYPVIVTSYERLPPHDTGDLVIVKDELKARCTQLIGAELATLTQGVKLYQLFDHVKGGIA